MRVYRVKLNEGHVAQPNQIVDGYLGNNFDDGKIQLYSIGQAKKKAMMFDGKTEPFGKSFTISKVSMLQLAASELSDGVKTLLGERIAYANMGNTIHFGCVFADILTDNKGQTVALQYNEEIEGVTEPILYTKELEEELTILDILVTHYDYVQILGN